MNESTTIPSMELRVLRYYLAVAKAGSFTRAAQQLHVTQPTLSRQLMDLEDELNCKLFDRRHHRVALTQEGLLLMRRAEEMLSLAGKTESEFRHLGKGVSGEIRIGAGETDAMDDVAAVMAAITRKHPRVHFHLFDDSSARVLEMLDRGLLDFGVVIQPIDISRYESLVLPTLTEWGLMMRKDDPLAAKSSLTFEDIRCLPIFCSRMPLDPKSMNARSYPGWLAEALPKLNIVGSKNLFYNTIFLLEHGMGYALSIRLRALLAEGASLCFRPFSPAVISQTCMVWGKEQVFSPASAHFLAALKRQFGSPSTS